jgi:hypothetical protein
MSLNVSESSVCDAGIALVERKLSNSTVRYLVSISDADWDVACRRWPGESPIES